MVVEAIAVGVVVVIGLICVIFTWAAVSLRHFEEENNAGEE